MIKLENVIYYNKCLVKDKLLPNSENVISLD